MRGLCTRKRIGAVEKVTEEDRRKLGRDGKGEMKGRVQSERRCGGKRASIAVRGPIQGGDGGDRPRVGLTELCQYCHMEEFPSSRATAVATSVAFPCSGPT
ncbi:hypothetical protein MRX96_059598 [Rhipicephalus microplus]